MQAWQKDNLSEQIAADSHKIMPNLFGFFFFFWAIYTIAGAWVGGAQGKNGFGSIAIPAHTKIQAYPWDLAECHSRNLEILQGKDLEEQDTERF